MLQILLVFPNVSYLGSAKAVQYPHPRAKGVRKEGGYGTRNIFAVQE